jgi:hypothetical protein
MGHKISQPLACITKRNQHTYLVCYVLQLSASMGESGVALIHGVQPRVCCGVRASAKMCSLSTFLQHANVLLIVFERPSTLQ